jgi:FixJ family two-component response regulator
MSSSVVIVTLMQAIQRAVANDVRDRGKEARVAEIQKRVKMLTPRETEVFALVVTGMLNKQIAFKLGVPDRLPAPPAWRGAA